MGAGRLLTPRQMEVARLVAEGRTGKAIARELGLSVRTVEIYVSRIASRIEGEGRPRIRITRWWYQQPGPERRN